MVALYRLLVKLNHVAGSKENIRFGVIEKGTDRERKGRGREG
jgi:hypothetical protein